MQHVTLERPGVLGAAIAAAFLCSWLGIPIPWLLGPMAAGLLIAVVGGRPRSMPRSLQTGAQAVLGVSIGLTFPPEALTLLGSNLPALLAVIVITGGLSMLNGWMLHRWAGIDLASGFLGSVPGAASGMVAVSAEIGADARMVAVLQYVRLLTVAFLSPMMIDWLFPLAGASGTMAAAIPVHATHLPEWAGLPVIALAGGAGLWIAGRVRIPSGMFLVPMLLTLAVTWTGLVHPAMPVPVFAAALLSLGVSIGVQFDWPTIRRLKRAAQIELLQVLALMAISVGLGYGLSWATGIDPRTAVLGTVPGAMEAQIALAFTLGAEAPLVVAMHTIRVLIMIVAGPWVAAKLTVTAANHRSD